MEDKKHCPTCKKRNNCPWLDISNDNCEGEFYEKGRPANKKKHGYSLFGIAKED